MDTDEDIFPVDTEGDTSIPAIDNGDPVGGQLEQNAGVGNPIDRLVDEDLDDLRDFNYGSTRNHAVAKQFAKCLSESIFTNLTQSISVRLKLWMRD